jgi:hypothetical protein
VREFNQAEPRGDGPARSWSGDKCDYSGVTFIEVQSHEEHSDQGLRASVTPDSAAPIGVNGAGRRGDPIGLSGLHIRTFVLSAFRAELDIRMPVVEPAD